MIFQKHFKIKLNILNNRRIRILHYEDYYRNNKFNKFLRIKKNIMLTKL